MFRFPDIASLLGSSASMELDLGCGILGYESHEKKDSERAERWDVEKHAKMECLRLRFYITFAFVHTIGQA